MFSVFANETHDIDKPKPISLRLDDIRSALPEIIRINRLAQPSPNDGNESNDNDKVIEQNVLRLETPTSELFDIFPREGVNRDIDVQMEDVTTVRSDGNPLLLSLSNLGLSSNALTETALKFDLSEYKRRRHILGSRSFRAIEAAATAEPMDGVVNNGEREREREQEIQLQTDTLADGVPQASPSVRSMNISTSAVEVAPVLTPSTAAIGSEQSAPKTTALQQASQTATTSAPITKDTAVINTTESHTAIASLPSVPTEADDTLKEQINLLYKDENITEDLSKQTTATTKIYMYQPHIIPIFATSQQRNFVDANLAKGLTVQWKNQCHEIIDYLNAPSTFPLNPRDINISGKLMFLKNLLDCLADTDRMLAILVRGLEEESALEIWMEQLNLQHAKMSNMGDSSWEGDYGILVKTKRQQDSTSIKLKRLTDGLDIILCMDARLNQAPSTFLRNMKSRRGKVAPIAWLITMGCIEEYIFRSLMDMTESVSFESALRLHSERLKPLLKEASAWPQHEKYRDEILTQFVADHVAQWIQLEEKSHPEDYQFRTTLELPRATHKANLFSPSTDEATEIISQPISTTATAQMAGPNDTTAVIPPTVRPAAPNTVITPSAAATIVEESPADNEIEDMDISDSEEASGITIPPAPVVTTKATTATASSSADHKFHRILDNEVCFSIFYSN
ncbi:hypothetical protein BDF20DRAFT_859313 [Mycotypha africana]|uniref:uncharacterized protein n=1 Tax=Mycotypha africana TaxID=64632 RepID=UPI0022FFF444|nr:uncharacterized protein BDF20DRAFT_859313 [Mycotypha africana]KAI8984333.1 hypothetical protein BDF20DRAFT_859313 [Mycotypha africana]